MAKTPRLQLPPDMEQQRQQAEGGRQHAMNMLAGVAGEIYARAVAPLVPDGRVDLDTGELEPVPDEEYRRMAFESRRAAIAFLYAFGMEIRIPGQQPAEEDGSDEE